MKQISLAVVKIVTVGPVEVAVIGAVKVAVADPVEANRVRVAVVAEEDKI